MIGLSQPFGRGTTGYGGRTPDANNLIFAPQLGQLRAFKDENPNTGVQLSGLEVICMLTRNLIGSALLPGQPVLLSTPGNTGATVTQSATPNVFFGVVDEYLPAAGVPDDDVFWLVLRGPVSVIIASSSGASIGQLYMPSGSANGKLDIIDPTPDDDAEAMNQAIYATAAAIATVTSGDTTARLCLRSNMFGA